MSDDKKIISRNNNEKIYSDDFNHNLLNENTCGKNSVDLSNINNINIDPKEEIKNLNLSRYYATISNIFYCFSAVSLKIMEKALPSYNVFLMVSYRFVFFALSSYFFIYRNKILLRDIFELKEKKWFFIRIITNFLGLITYKFSFDYIRLGLSLSLVMFSPIWGNFF